MRGTGVGSLFDVDTVRNITNKVSEIAGKHYGDSDKTDVPCALSPTTFAPPL